ncbi:hypothetical protein CFBP498_38110 [Xanthomonas hortorum pv. vitians]|uniref:Uncharacterized protein n=1 Tax=Xanthomonas hortorum pv. vitians TaxID=83224 RepID=A0A6V7EPW9_9XANT|nr:hypothetical protein [Xanthomonas hortorum]APP85429.1 hypothetical protein BI317_15875 [Xanthomonas hortorum pv. gardneri]MCE4302925.1 hypothetical protein [Xanthomonas hortorum pv. vitians]MCE4311047.1 hypothetical protein [Xanthomonas hortorum pv. vitians]MDT7825248.1 hypothetical protein [Xanthomonas hortorum pv. vitians]NMI31631.1 hypothetical protein [Xanthomonas hortorum pv. vitians]
MSRIPTDNIVQLPKRTKGDVTGPLTVVHNYGGCRHAHTEVDEKKAEVTCRDCGEKINPIWLLMQLATEDRMLRDRWASMKAELSLMGERVKTKCQHCGQMTRIRSNASSTEISRVADQIKREEK